MLDKVLSQVKAIIKIKQQTFDKEKERNDVLLDQQRLDQQEEIANQRSSAGADLPLCHKKLWYKINSKPDVIIFEGWCVGAKAQKNSELVRSINSLEKREDPDLVWRNYVNVQLKTHYKKLFKQINEIIYLRANNFKMLQKWRIKQEKTLWLKSKNKRSLRIMNRGDIINFMQTYQRITQSMFKDAPKYASIVMKLNSNHQINSIKFR